MKTLGLSLDFERVEDVGKMVIVEIESANYSKNNGTFKFFLILWIHLCWGERGTLPKLANFGGVGIGLEFVGAIFENLIELIDLNSEFIWLYNLGDDAFHFLLFFNEFYH